MLKFGKSSADLEKCTAMPGLNATSWDKLLGARWSTPAYVASEAVYADGREARWGRQSWPRWPGSPQAPATMTSHPATACPAGRTSPRQHNRCLIRPALLYARHHDQTAERAATYDLGVL